MLRAETQRHVVLQLEIQVARRQIVPACFSGELTHPAGNNVLQIAFRIDKSKARITKGIVLGFHCPEAHVAGHRHIAQLHLKIQLAVKCQGLFLYPEGRPVIEPRFVILALEIRVEQVGTHCRYGVIAIRCSRDSGGEVN